MISPYIFKYDGRALRVKKCVKYQTSYDEDTAYIIGDYNPYVYIYRGKIKNWEDGVEPGIYLKKGKTFIVRPMSDNDKRIYSRKNIIKLTPESIFQNLNPDDLIDTNDNKYFTADDELFKPAINDTDDIALAGLKFALCKKNIMFGNYANKFQDSATKNNGKRAITHGSSLKMDMLSRFANVFDLNVGVIFADKNDCPNPMDPDRSKAYVIFDDEPIDLDSKEIIQITKDELE